VPRRFRYGTQLVLALGGSAAGFVAVLAGWGAEQTAVVGAVAVDGVTLFLQGTLLVVAALGVLLMAARRGTRSRVRSGPGTWSRAAATLDRGLDAFTPQAAAVPGSA
ncbi:NADH-quinone oxidoreductase subunit N, partial [Nocardia farcinica]|nr:NADH-quinone oxidoreductase subunit N [Nocardia farcinica]